MLYVRMFYKNKVKVVLEQKMKCVNGGMNHRNSLWWSTRITQFKIIL